MIWKTLVVAVEHFLNYLRIRDRVKFRVLPMRDLVNTNMRILDVGSGSGSWADYLEHRPRRHTVIVDVCDVEDYSLTHSRTYKKATMFSSPHLPFPNGRFDLVMFMFCLHHAADPKQQRDLLSEGIRVLRPGGHILIVEDLKRSEADNDMMALHGRPDNFHSMREWKTILQGLDTSPVRDGLIPRWYNGYFTFISSYQPEQGWLIQCKRDEMNSVTMDMTC